MKLTMTFEDVCRRLGCVAGELPRVCRSRFESINPAYRLSTPEEAEEHILHVLHRIHEQPPARSAQENKTAFEAGWNENYELCRQQGLSWETLRPRYVKPFGFVRLDRRYVVPEDPFLPDNLLSLYATIGFSRHLAEAETIYEFGCGTGRFLHLLSELFPDKSLVGADWTEASFKILLMMAGGGRHIEGVVFDMLHPARQLELPPDSAVVTIGAMEQLGTSFGPFLDYLLANKPRVVLHHEPILEFYSRDHLADYLAILYHQKRGYLAGYWPALEQLAREGRIEILAGQRLFSGDPYHESSSLIVWRPL